MKNTLYDIKENYLALINEVEEMEGELTPEMENKLKINQNELQNKAISYHSFILSKDSFNLQIDTEIKRLQALKKGNNKIIDRLKTSLISAVEMFGGFTVGTNNFTLRKSEQVICEDVNLLPKEYKTIKVVETPDKKAIKDALKLGINIKNTYIREINNLKIN